MTNGSEAAFKGFAIIFAGSDISADVGKFVGNGALGGTTTVNTVGFESEIMFGMCCGEATGSGADYLFSLGVLDSTGAVITQGSVTRFTEDLSDPVELSARHATNRFLSAIDSLDCQSS